MARVILSLVMFLMFIGHSYAVELNIGLIPEQNVFQTVQEI